MIAALELGPNPREARAQQAYAFPAREGQPVVADLPPFQHGTTSYPDLSASSVGSDSPPASATFSEHPLLGRGSVSRSSASASVDEYPMTVSNNPYARRGSAPESAVGRSAKGNRAHKVGVFALQRAAC
jgi:hypothetical protein